MNYDATQLAKEHKYGIYQSKFVNHRKQIPGPRISDKIYFYFGFCDFLKGIDGSVWSCSA